VVETVFFPVVFPWTTSWWFNHQHIFWRPLGWTLATSSAPKHGDLLMPWCIDLKFKTTSKNWVIRWYQMLHPHFFRWLARSQGEKVLKTDISGLQQLSKTCVQAKMASGWTPPPGAGWPGLFKQQHAATKIGCNEATRIGMNRKMRSFGEVYLLYSIYGSVYSWGNW
jgi:hypothetical protein